jgi:hypothetical protein
VTNPVARPGKERVQIELTREEAVDLALAACHPHTGWAQDHPTIGPAVRKIDVALAADTEEEGK